MMRRLSAALGLACVASAARAADNGVGERPYLGWSSWSLQATTAPGYGRDWLTAARVVEQADRMRKELGAHGYVYVNVDSFWSDRCDAAGRPLPNSKTFPDGIKALADHLHAQGQRLGLYLVPGVSDAVYDRNPTVVGTAVRVRDILATPRRQANAFGGRAIDYARPGAQAYVDSIARQLADWGVDFLKLDGMVPGSDVAAADGARKGVDTRPDAAAWSAALKKTGRPVWLTLSWALPAEYADVWQKYANAWRVNGDVERYGPTLCGWEQVKRRFAAQPAWAGKTGPGLGWADLDSLAVASGDLDGLTADEKRTAVSFWALCCSPLYVGGDLTKLDAAGRASLTNDAVIALDQAGRPATRAAGGDTPVWSTPQADGSVVVGLFNLTDGERRVGVDPAAVGVTRPVVVDDLWTGRSADAETGRLERTLAPHAVGLLRLRARR